jgi:hypothetical protein
LQKVYTLLGKFVSDTFEVKDARNDNSPRPSVEKVFAELFSKSDYFA